MSNLKKIILVAENISKNMSGEANINLYYLNKFQERNIDCFVVCHGRVKEEIKQLFPEEEFFSKFYFIEDNWLQILIYKISKFFPIRIKEMIFGQILFAITQLRARTVVKDLIKHENIDLVFQPSPITPKGLNYMYNLAVPVVLGPLSGGLDFPPAFQYMDSKITKFIIDLSRALSNLLHIIIPGKIQADVLIVSNKKTEKVLPKGYKGQIYYLFDSGVDLNLWKQKNSKTSIPDGITRFVFMGRFVDWKGVQFLIEALALAVEKSNITLDLIGDGELREQLEKKVKELKLSHRVTFHGWLSTENCLNVLNNSDVFVMPSLREAGGNAVLEAMAIGMPVIVANWSGLSTIVSSDCGILVEPDSREDFVNGLAQAIIELSDRRDLRQEMGKASAQRVRTNYFDWDSKVDRLVEIFQYTLQTSKKQLS